MHISTYEKRLFFVFIAFTILSFAKAQVVVSGALVGNGSYTTLSSAFSALNGGAQTNATILVLITANVLESGVPTSLNEGAWASLTITPSGARTISGEITAGNPLINLNGADRVTINGLNSNGNSLTISNTTASNAANTSTIRLINGANNNTITNCTILGSHNAAAGTSPSTFGGTIFFSTDLSSNGNSNNTISFCDVGPAGSNLPTKGIFSSLSTTVVSNGYNNENNSILNCSIYDYFSATVSSSGILLNDGNTSWTISNNKFYQTSARTQTTGSEHTGIKILSSSASGAGSGFTISNNVIGFASASETGTYSINGVANTRFNPMRLSFLGSPDSDISNVTNNTIKNIAMSGTINGTIGTSCFIGINCTNGKPNISNNTIGSVSDASSINISSTTTSNSDIYGISYNGTFEYTVNGNTVSGIKFQGNNSGRTIYGIRLVGGNNCILNNNQIGSLNLNNAIESTSTSPSSSVTGIMATGPTSSIVASGNTISSLSAAGGVGGGISLVTLHAVSGMVISPENTHSIENNTISNLRFNGTANTSSRVCGIHLLNNFNSTINRNFIHSLVNSSTSTEAEVYGIRVISGSATYANNMVRLGIDNAGQTLSLGNISYYGISDENGQNNFYHNSVYIGGVVASGVNSSYAFRSLVESGIRNIYNNIFFNARSGVGSHYTVSLAGVSPNPAGLQMDYNLLLANGTGGNIGQFNGNSIANLTNWRTLTGQDNNSISADPNFINPTGSGIDVDLHIQPPPATTPIEGVGFLINAVTNDFDNESRSNFTPVDIGADAGNFILGAASISCNSQFQTTVSNCNAANFVAEEISSNLLYSWDLGNGEGSNLAQANQVYDSPGDYNVCLTTSGSGCNTSQTCNNLTIEDPQTLSVSISPEGPINLCAGESVNLNLPSNLTNISWSSGQTTSTIIVNTSGNYIASANTANGCFVLSNSVDVFVDNSGPGSILITSNQNFICENGTVILTASNEFQNYTWSNGVSGSNTITVSAPGSYSVSASSANNCPSSSNPFTIGFAPAIQTNIIGTQISNSEYQFQSNAQNVTNFLWSFGDGETSNDENPTHFFQNNGVYSITLTASNECDTVTSSISVNITNVSIQDINGIEFEIYPNPTNGLIYFKQKAQKLEKYTVSVYNQLGQVIIKASPFLENADAAILDLSTLNSGVYFISLDEDGTIPIKVQKVILVD